jgi:hypothetical protein
VSPKQIKDMMTWLHKQGIRYTTITIGGMTLDGVVNTRDAGKPEKIEPRQSLFQQYAGPLLTQTSNPVDDVPDEAKID